MSRAIPKMRGIAERLIAYETKGHSFETRTAAASLVCEKLRPHLGALMGKTGFRALLSRALALAGKDVSWLRDVHVKEDDSWEADEVAAQVDPEEIAEGRVVLVTHLLGLLVAFIGENLAVRLVGEVWPKLSFDDLDSRKGDKNEKAK